VEPLLRLPEGVLFDAIFIILSEPIHGKPSTTPFVLPSEERSDGKTKSLTDTWSRQLEPMTNVGSMREKNPTV
jgi:hypothetical protein